MSHLMSQELGQAIINYLGTQPYGQVAQMVQGMQQMGEIDDKAFAAFMAEAQAKQQAEAEEGRQKGETDAEANAD